MSSAFAIKNSCFYHRKKKLKVSYIVLNYTNILFAKTKRIISNLMSSKTSDLEQQIVLLLSTGDRKAIDLAYQNYSKTLYGVILRIVQSEEVAEEILQDVFVKIWINAKSYNRTKGRLFTWFVNIARNASIDFIRTRRNKESKRTTSIENPVYENVAGSTEMEINDFGLKKVIDSLDEKHRLLIELTYFKGYSQREIEKEFDIPLGTVKSRLRIAVNQLREKLGDEQVRNLLLCIAILLTLAQTQAWILPI